MASNSPRKSGSSGRRRKKVVLSVPASPPARGESPTKKGKRQVKVDTATSPRARQVADGSALSAAAARVANARRDERKQRVVAKKRTVKLRWILVAAGICAVIVLSMWAYTSPMFAIRAIEVTGLQRVQQKVILARVDDVAHGTIFSVSENRVRAAVMEDPWVKSADVRISPLGTLSIKVTEREPLAVVDPGGKTLWLVDSEGMWLAPHAADMNDSLIVIRDVVGLQPRAGVKSEDKVLRNALRVVASLGASLTAEARAISAPSIDRTRLFTTADVEVFFGSSDQAAEKAAIAWNLLEKNRGSAVYINVRSLRSPTWRGVAKDE